MNAFLSLLCIMWTMRVDANVICTPTNSKHEAKHDRQTMQSQAINKEN